MFPAMIAAASQLIGAVGSLNAAPATPGIAGPSGGALGNKADVDMSGWTVATGKARAEGATISKTSSDAIGQQPGGAAAGLMGGNAGATLAGMGISPGMVGIAGALLLGAVLWRMSKK